jgi:hypothetical protein
MARNDDIKCTDVETEPVKKHVEDMINFLGHEIMAAEAALEELVKRMIPVTVVREVDAGPGSEADIVPLAATLRGVAERINLLRRYIDMLIEGLQV